MRQRRRPPPPPLDRELLRLVFPRELAARSERPLEYPENASDLVPLRSVAAVRVDVVPRASVVPDPRVWAVLVLRVCALLRACAAF
jgi:hypothetical protein